MNALPDIDQWRKRCSFATSAKRLAGVAAAAGLSLALAALAGPAFADAGFERWVASFRATAAQSGISGATYDRAFRGVTEPDPEVLEKARYQPEFTAPVWDYFDNRVHEHSVAVGRAMAQQVQAVARPDRGALRRRPLHPARHLVDGIELRRDPQERQGDAQRRALAGDACLCRQEARQIRPHPADRGAEDPADAATSTKAT